MSDWNAKNNRAVWFDIPVADLDRATRFYQAVMAVPIEKVAMEHFSFCVIDHEDGNGGCLVPEPGSVGQKGPLVYLNAEGRIHDAEAQAAKHGGKVLEKVHPIGRHGFRSIVLGCEGNRIALHSSKDA